MKYAGLIFGLLMATACQAADEPHKPHRVIASHVDAFNAGDIDAISALHHPDIEWFGIDGSDMKLEISGKLPMKEMLTQYRTSNPDVRGTLQGWSRNGDYIAVTETARWPAEGGGTNEQSALAVYQMEDGLIRRVWYFPPVKPDTDTAPN